ncbi:hypothetical protein GCM10012275_54770 [Longimycelium tulufanense]|uniref:Uncharacterized protein n=1 Tax=Longimycelium tulufanense TaxID=907463 RepID=A0A8J3CDE9_9PSEU|nr:hypothetical protein [Longimycelium tulufanense]GGM77170.1 hypothetical protein GCM10012275_54770 [Longimycelium tulufanense]
MPSPSPPGQRDAKVGAVIRLVCTDRDASYTYACDHCVNDTRHRLRELEQYVLGAVELELPRHRSHDAYCRAP